MNLNSICLSIEIINKSVINLKYMMENALGIIQLYMHLHIMDKLSNCIVKSIIHINPSKLLTWSVWMGHGQQLPSLPVKILLKREWMSSLPPLPSLLPLPCATHFYSRFVLIHTVNRKENPKNIIIQKWIKKNVSKLTLMNTAPPPPCMKVEGVGYCWVCKTTYIATFFEPGRLKPNVFLSKILRRSPKIQICCILSNEIGFISQWMHAPWVVLLLLFMVNLCVAWLLLFSINL